MKVLFALTLAVAATAFAPQPVRVKRSTALDLKRRDVLAGLAGLVAAPAIANAAASTWFFDEKIEEVREPAQMSTGGKLDINNAPVVSRFST